MNFFFFFICSNKNFRKFKIPINSREKAKGLRYDQTFKGCKGLGTHENILYLEKINDNSNFIRPINMNHESRDHKRWVIINYLFFVLK